MRQLWKFLLIVAVLALFAIPAFAQTATTTPSLQGSTSANTIGVGDTVNGSLTTAQPSATYTLRAEMGQVVSITLNSDAFDAYLTLKDGSGNVLAENDDVSGTNSAIQDFTLPSASSYVILVESYGQHNNSGAETGAYTLSVAEQHIQSIEYGQSIDDQLTTAEPSKDYTFTGQAGDVIVASESSTDNNFDAYLHLLDSTGTELTNNDDSGGTLNSLIGPYTLPSTGNFTLRATTVDGGTAGAFTLKLDKTEVTTLDYDQTVEASFTPTNSVKYFTFTGTSGDMITISTDSGQSIDTNLTLNDSNNNQVATDDNGGPGFDPEIYQQLLTTSGAYTIVLQANAPGTGKVKVTLKHTTPPSLDEGSQTMTFTSSTTDRAVSFTATANQTVNVHLHLSSGTSGSPSVTVTQSDSTIASASGSTLSDLSFSFTPTSDGTVVIQVSDSTGAISYQVTLTKAAQ